MSFQWTLAATFLYIEGVFIIVLLLPLISPQRFEKLKFIFININVYF